MTTLNKVLSISESIGINDHRFIGQAMSRNQRISTSEIITVQPFMFDMKPMNYLLYSQNRELLSVLRAADRQYEQYLNFGATGWSSYIKYQGDMISAEIEACNWKPASANKTLVLGDIPVGVTSGEYIVRTGDFCQVGRYSYIATADVLRGVASTVNIPVHRTLITTLASDVGAVIGEYGTTIALGGNTYLGTTFPVILQEYPTYTFVPMTNDSFIAWNGTFKAIEAVL
jgi:hypothetical protein